MASVTNGDVLVVAGEHENHEPHFEPIIYLPEIIVNTMENDEVILIQERAKLFRHDKEEEEWKERGTGDVKLLHNEKSNTVRVVMRREKTLKLCANHYVTKEMELKPNCGSDRAWVWTTGADISDGEPKSEVLAIKFQNPTVAKKWKDAFEEAKLLISDKKLTPSNSESSSSVSESDDDDSAAEVVNKVSSLSIQTTEEYTVEITKPANEESAKNENDNLPPKVETNSDNKTN